MSSGQNTTVRCPNCRQPVQVQVHSIIDVGKEPQLKAALLRGQINALACPHCGYRGMLGTPTLYHDPAKQLALIFFPMELGMKREDEERQIGKLTNALMDSTPQEQRKMYMLSPRRLLSWQSMTEEILAADGITKEMLDKQAAQVRLLDTLLRGASSEAELDRLIAEHKSEIDQSFIDLISSLARSSSASGDAQSGAQLLQVGVLLAQKTGLKPPAGSGAITVDELLEEMLAARDDRELREMVAAVHGALDYKFYQTLTARIEKAPAEEAARLKTLREKLLKISEELEKQTQAALKDASQLLQRVLRSPEPAKEIAANLEKMDEAFLMVLQANIQQATEQKQEQVAHVLEDIYQEVITQLQAKMPPPMRFVNELLSTEPSERAALLQSRKAEINPELLDAMEQVANDLVAQGRNEIAAEVAVLLDQAQDVLEPIEDTLAPELRFVGALIRATPGERAEQLRTLGGQLTPAQLEQMQALVQTFQEQGRPYLAAQMRAVVNQAKAWISPVAAA